MVANQYRTKTHCARISRNIFGTRCAWVVNYRILLVDRRIVAKCQSLYNSILISEKVSDMGEDDVDDTQPVNLTLGQPSQTPFSPTQMVEDTRDSQYHPTLEEEYPSLDSEDDIVARRCAIPVYVAKNLATYTGILQRIQNLKIPNTLSTNI